MQFGKSMITTAMLLAVLAAGKAAADPETMAMTMKLKQKYPNTQFSDIRKSVIPGLWEVVMGRNIAYADETGRYFLFGHVYDMEKQQDLTADVKEGLNRVDFASLPLQDAIKFTKGDGRRVFAVFSDPDCPYCKKLEAELEKMNDYTAYVFLMPLESIHPEAPKKAETVWCSKDRGEAWKGLMVKGKEPTKASCPDNPIARNRALAEKFGISGTPTLIAGNGQLMPGYAPAARMEAWLDSNGGKSK